LNKVLTAKPRQNQQFSWFKLNRKLHRDIGYFCIGMTLVFAISGIAVNHIEDWNPNYKVTITTIELPGIAKLIDSPLLDQTISERLKISQDIRTNFWPSPSKYKLFFKNDINVVIDFPKETAVIEKIKPRTIFKALNLLHLNEMKLAWTYFSDLFAALLIFLALSSLFMVKGNKGVLGKRGGLVALGFMIPLGFILLSAN